MISVYTVLLLFEFASIDFVVEYDLAKTELVPNSVEIVDDSVDAFLQVTSYGEDDFCEKYNKEFDIIHMRIFNDSSDYFDGQNLTLSSCQRLDKDDFAINFT